ncbi:MAG: hypothetical protein GY820_04240 [Gammaproteobacteria bacterium]|nr:hypothetical protein [Gammaproteobacteria bacterium]
MIKTIFKFIGGFLFGAIIAFAVAYTFGSLMESMNIALYDSEAEQQRNFNIFLGFSICNALLFGYLGTKLGKKN